VYETKNRFPPSGISLLSSGLDSDDSANYCRGQGQFYVTKPANLFDLPTGDSQFNFSGFFDGCCCYCALGRGLCSLTFKEIGCYQCKRACMLIKEFSKLKAGGVNNANFVDCGWSGLSDALIDLILQMVSGGKTLFILK
jgi:hypothetical protein